MRAALPVTAVALIAALTGCGNATAETPAATETVTVAPSASPSPDKAEEYVEQIRTGIVEHNGTWEEQCEQASFKVSACFIDSLDAVDYKILAVTLDLTEDQVPELEVPFDQYLDAQAHEVTIDVYSAITEHDLVLPYPEQIQVRTPAGKMLGYAQSDRGLMFWHSDYSD